MKKLLLLFVFVFSNYIMGQSIISVSPNNGNRGQQDLSVSITMQNVDFSETTPIVDVSFVDQFGNILTANASGFVNSTQLITSLTIPGYAIPGLYDVKVTEENGAFTTTLADSFTVNTAYTYTIQGTVRYDSNGNGCDPSDPILPYQNMSFVNGPFSGNLTTNQAGFYNYYDVIAGNNNFRPILENPSYFTISPPNASVNVSAGNPLVVQNFCISPNGTQNDLEVLLFATIPARPGFNASYRIIYKNKGTTIQNGSVALTFDDTIMDLISATPALDSQNTNTLSWNFSNLGHFESRAIDFTMNINSPAEVPAVNNGDLLTFNATVNGNTDLTPANNTSTLEQTVVGSYDPNDKTCTDGPSMPIAEVGKYLNYVIRFENTGTTDAEFVVIRDIIDTSKFEINTLIPLSSSHPFVTRISETNKVEFIFENINLPFDDANNDGFVTFKIKTKSTLPIGTDISNRASIFFDYNLPIITNTYTTNVFNPLSTNDFDFGSAFTLSPVPAKNNLTISNKQNISITSANIYNTLGQLVQAHNSPTDTIDVSGLKTGSYFIKIISDKGTASSKFVKE